VNDDYLFEEVIRNGGHDVLTKPLQTPQVVAAVKLAWSYWKQSSAKR
jgi:FixJ family two-component response regulator